MLTYFSLGDDVYLNVSLAVMHHLYIVHNTSVNVYIFSVHCVCMC